MLLRQKRVKQKDWKKYDTIRCGMMTEEKIFLIKEMYHDIDFLPFKTKSVELTKEEIEHLILELYPDIENPCSKCDNILKKLESLNG